MLVGIERLVALILRFPLGFQCELKLLLLAGQLAGVMGVVLL